MRETIEGAPNAGRKSHDHLETGTTIARLCRPGDGKIVHLGQNCLNLRIQHAVRVVVSDAIGKVSTKGNVIGHPSASRAIHASSERVRLCTRLLARSQCNRPRRGEKAHL
jgi:hypothetical protein